MLAQPLQSQCDALAKLRHVSIPGRMSTSEKRDEIDFFTGANQLLSNLKGDRRAGAVTGDRVRPIRLKFANLRREIRAQFFDSGKRFAVIFQSRRLQPEEGLIAA